LNEGFSIPLFIQGLTLDKAAIVAKKNKQGTEKEGRFHDPGQGVRRKIMGILPHRLQALFLPGRKQGREASL
jgi:hypothetical protein